MRKANAAGRRQCNSAVDWQWQQDGLQQPEGNASGQRTTGDAQATDLSEKSVLDAGGQKAAVESEG